MLKSRTADGFAAATVRRASVNLSAILLATAMLGCATPRPGPSNAPSASSREDIYVLRSVREERSPKSNWCTGERTGLTPFNSGFNLEDRYTMWSVVVTPQDGRIANAKASIAGELHACFGATADPKVVSFYTDGRIAGLPFTGRGDCLVARRDYPEKGITTFRCYLELGGLPSPYVGGSLTTNTINTKALLGDEAYPPGYTQASITTIRLWRTR